MSIVKHAIISAAGMGSRLQLNIPKCLVEIDGKKLIDYQLELLEDIEDVRIVVGFKEMDVINHVLQKRKDVTFIRNPDYQKTSNSYSVYLATKDLKEPFISLDGDLLLEPDSFINFIKHCDNHSLIAITESKTEEAVFVNIDDDSNIIDFKLSPPTKYEWSGLAYIKGFSIEKNGGYIFKELEKHLPLKSIIINCHEIDTPEDLHSAYKFFDKNIKSY